MKKLSSVLIALPLFLVFFFVPRPDSVAVAQNLADGPFRTDADLARYIKRVTDRSAKGLVEKTNPDGSVSVNLGEGFQYLMLSRLDAYGTPVTACVTSLAEANNFFRRDLETGAPLAGAFRPEPVDLTASRHGMSVKEFRFYQDLIKSFRENRLLGPNAVNISIVNNDGAGEGFNDNTPVAPEGGNNGATLGAQRLNVFEAAAQIWEAFLDSSVEVEVESNFDPLPCTQNSVVLGGASATTVHRNFSNADLANTWYHQAIANKQAGRDLSLNEDMRARFNSSLNGDPNCFGGRRFYLGLDNFTSPTTRNLFIVVLHEMGHGLGFSDFSDAETGELFNGFPDVFTSNMYDRTTMKFWNDMTNGERQTSAINENNVLWDGPNVKIASDSLTNARDAEGRVELYTPNPVEQGSSISHWNTSATPNLLMEPFISLDLPIALDLTPQQMRDVGWFRDSDGDGVPDTITNVAPNGGTLVIGSQATVSWNNIGGFNRNVTIELSTDGGNTYPVELGRDVPNTGSFNFMVPNMPTNQAKVRVREFDFAAPFGESTSTFSIDTSVVPMETRFDFEGDGKADVGIFRPGPGEWWYLRSSDNMAAAFQFGTGTDTITPADFTGDGRTDIAFFRPQTGEWFVLRSEDSSFFSFPFGQQGDIPAPGDFDGDGEADPAVFRPSIATWFYIRSSDGQNAAIQFGLNGDVPIVEDYDGDGMDDIAVYRPSVAEWYLNRSTDGFIGYAFGTPGSTTPVPADYTGDGRTDIAFFNPNAPNGQENWFVLRSDDDSFFAFPFGMGMDVPVPGDYDGDGRADPAVFRPSSNTWFLQQTTDGFEAVGFGIAGDVPVPAAYQP